VYDRMIIVTRVFGKTKFYQFITWLYGRFLEDLNKHDPSKFREYGNNVVIDKSVHISNPENVILKDNVLLTSGVHINSIGGLYIGENTGVAQNCVIVTSNHHYRNAESIPFDKTIELKPVIIRENVWFGIGVMITPGVEIGEGAILGMGAVITHNVPPLAIVLGNPAEVIGYRSKEHYYKCKAENKTQCPVFYDFQPRLIEIYKIKYEKELIALGLLK
jgi:maltose O-acetyltransferase